MKPGDEAPEDEPVRSALEDVKTVGQCVRYCREVLSSSLPDAAKSELMASAYYFTAHAFIASHAQDLPEWKREALRDKVADNALEYKKMSPDELGFLTRSENLGTRLFSFIKQKLKNKNPKHFGTLSHAIPGPGILNPEIAREELERELEIRDAMLKAVEKRPGVFGSWIRKELQIEGGGIPELWGKHCEATASGENCEYLSTFTNAEGKGDTSLFYTSRAKLMESLHANPVLKPKSYTSKIEAQAARRAEWLSEK